MDETDMSDDHESFSDASISPQELNSDIADLPSTSKEIKVETIPTSTLVEAILSSHSSDDSDVSDSKIPSIPWQKASGTHLKIFTFLETCGVNTEVATFLKDKREIDFFKHFLDNAIIEKLVVETNRYANQKFISGIVDESITSHSRLNKWVPVHDVEMHVFLGILLWMSLDKKPCLADYWSRSILYNSAASQYMSRNRCELLLRMWHFSDNEACVKGDKLHKVTTLTEHLVAKYKACIVPGEELYLDQVTIPFQGRKRLGHKFGIKLLKLCLKGGYTYNMDIYCGKEGIGKIVPKTVVINLMDSLLGKGRTLYTNRCCTSIMLARELLNQSTHLIGMLRPNQNLNPQILSASLKRGEIIGQENTDGIVIMKWKDKDETLILSTKHTDLMMKVNAKNGQRVKPAAVIDYNTISISSSHKTTSCSSSVKRSVKWYRKVALEIILCTTVDNALFLYNTIHKKNINITKFKENLCLQLLQYCTTHKMVISNLTTNAEKHKLEVCIENNKIIRQRCKSCYAKFSREKGRIFASNNAKRVKNICPACPNKPHMCNNCFFEIHQAAAHVSIR